MDEQQIRAAALNAATDCLAPIPSGNPKLSVKDNRIESYISLAERFAQYIREGRQHQS
jgi:hypothetical protein